MRKVMIFIFALIVCIVSVGAERREPHYESIDWEGQGFQKMHVTAYYKGHHTANGSAVHEGGCACNPHLGDVAIVYTTSGQYLGIYECNDTGSASGLVNGTTIDIYRSNLTRCQMLMKITATESGSSMVYVKWVKGDG